MWPHCVTSPVLADWAVCVARLTYASCFGILEAPLGSTPVGDLAVAASLMLPC